ncbi:UDP-2,3-diacylglucosamine diphosphatase [Helicobacter cetorum]|uniref:UDP-2,3-diacylglucosamine hydrolase n=1 Tax=Helicobacter cetorum (strain ATCC BAA-540 / CCUG 52418 / MIT 99-5656) TaxID=1163745 RepID=I0ERI6_HELCM|nr:UDP-2,3-diacylglucosamine diphosphatase [Helicobacter cetorum]AFI05555.1 UDP-2,3-diacylglucosamine hydrolase [Helicobacter cetorum MIT 99-5656]
MLEAYTLKIGAVFISDAHFLPKSSHLMDLLRELLQTKPPQVFFMGDIFHVLVGYLPLDNTEKEIIGLINALSQISQVFYFEGNHDFSMRFVLSPSVIVFERKHQPALFQCNDKRFLLAHGDLFITKAYEFYITQLTSTWARFFLSCLNLMSFKTLYPLLKKLIYKKPIRLWELEPTKLQSFIQQRLKAYQNYITQKGLKGIDGIIEGHFHIKRDKRSPLNTPIYYPLPSFYYQQSIFRVSSKDLERLQ